MEEKNHTNAYLVAIVAIVAIIGLVVLYMYMGKAEQPTLVTIEQPAVAVEQPAAAEEQAGPVTGQPILPPLKGCTDSDGDNPNVYGIVRFGTSSYNDTCIDKLKLGEYICLNGVASGKQYTCQYGCLGGVCQSSPTLLKCADGDFDTYRNPAFPAGCTMSGTADCNDGNAAVHPGATEICGNGVDEDCSGADLACAPCTDADGDGFQNPNSPAGCTLTIGYGLSDCNDANAAINPWAAEICGNSVDENCDNYLCTQTNSS